MYIKGIGIIFNRGRGAAVLQQALNEGWRLPVDSEAGAKVYRVSDELLRDQSISKDLRRADRFSRMAAIAAADAVKDSGIDLLQHQQAIGVIVSTGFGPHATTFKFLDDMLTYREMDVSPTVFSHSVHNAAASYIALALQLRGPTLTLTHFNFAFYEALLIAQSWIEQKKVSQVLVGAVDECGTVLEHIMSRKLRIASDGRIKPFAFSPQAEAVPGEGTVFFLLGAENSARGYVKITGLSGNGTEISDACHVLSADGFIGDETGYQRFAAGQAIGFGALFGTVPGQMAFALASAALIEREHPGMEAHREFTRGKYNPSRFKTIDCVTLGCHGDCRIISISS